MGMELNTKTEHFVTEVQIACNEVTVVCSCGKSFGPKKDETAAREEYDKHYKVVMK